MLTTFSVKNVDWKIVNLLKHAHNFTLLDVLMWHLICTKWTSNKVTLSSRLVVKFLSTSNFYKICTCHSHCNDDINPLMLALETRIAWVSSHEIDGVLANSALVQSHGRSVSWMRECVGFHHGKSPLCQRDHGWWICFPLHIRSQFLMKGMSLIRRFGLSSILSKQCHTSTTISLS